jgi:hypothetical protein
MSNFFGRKIELLVDGTKITNDFAMEFDVEFDDGPDVNLSEVVIYNLTDTTIRKFKKGLTATLNAGYTGDIGNILTGAIKFVHNDWEGVDKKTTITIADAGDTWLTKKINKTYKKDTTAKQILTDAIKISGLKIGKMSLPTNKVYKGGKTIKGPIGSILSEIIPDCNAKWHTTKGAIYITGKNEGTNSSVLLSKDSGLIETPTAYSKSETYKVNKTVVTYSTVNGKKKKKIEVKEEDKSRTLYGYKVKCLLNHRIKTDSIIHIKSLSANGKFRVAAGKHDGDNFVTELEVYSV